jgi:hypothetical protein
MFRSIKSSIKSSSAGPLCPLTVYPPSQSNSVTGAKLVALIAGLVPAISIRMAQCPIIGMGGTSPAMTKWC